MRYCALILVLLALALTAQAETFGTATDTTGMSGGFSGFVLAKLNQHSTLVHTATSGDIVTDLSIFGASGNGGRDSIYVKIVALSDNSCLDSAYIVTTSDTWAWYHVTGLSIALADGETYALALAREGINIWLYPYDFGIAGAAANAIDADGACPWITDANSNFVYPCYATYTPGGGSAPQSARRRKILGAQK